MLEKYVLYQRQIERKEDIKELINKQGHNSSSMNGLGTTKKTTRRKSKSMHQRQIERKEKPEDNEELKNKQGHNISRMDGLGTTKKTTRRKSKSMPLTNDAPANTTPAKVKLSDLSLMEQVRIRAQRQSDRRQSINTSLRSISSHGSGKDRIETFNNSPRTSIVDFGNKSYDSRNRCSRSRRSSISQSLSSILDDGNKRDSLSG